MVYHDLTSYLKAMSRWRSMSGKIINGDGYYFVRGELISDTEFNHHNSKPSYEPSYKENPDGRSIAPSVKVKSRK